MLASIFNASANAKLNPITVCMVVVVLLLDRCVKDMPESSSQGLSESDSIIIWNRLSLQVIFLPVKERGRRIRHQIAALRFHTMEK